MALINSILTWVMKKRIHEVELFMKHPIEVQQELFEKLLKQARDTEYGTKFEFKSIQTSEEFAQRVPVVTYETLFPYISRIMKGEQNLLWPSEIRWFAKSSGTTNAQSKFIPVSSEALEECHFKGGKDLISIYVNNHPTSRLFDGKGLAIGGSQQINEYDPHANSYYGDVSAVIMKNLPLWAQFVRTPSLEIALMEEWEEKIERMARATADENVTSISGVPTWTILLLRRILEIKGKSSIAEVWPNLELFVHGAVAFAPYKSLFQALIGRPDMNYLETYNASEGFFGIQDQSESDELLLMLDYGIYYEFIPFKHVGEENPPTLTLKDVKLGETYALVISTNAGLWRYQIGDTVKFTSTNPYRIKITGRTKHFINAFGEEVVIENAEYAVTKACEHTAAEITNFTAGPIYLGSGNKGGHEWIIEFAQQPNDLEVFISTLDETLKDINSDYQAKRYKDMALMAPVVHSVPQGTFYQWMKKRGKLGGQNKVPRLSNNREFLDDILQMTKV